MQKCVQHIIFLSVFLIQLASFSQSRKELEVQRKKYKSEIVKLNKLLFNEQQKEKNVLEELKDITQKIEVRNKLLATINLEAQLLSKEIAENEKKLLKLNQSLNLLKEDYADMIFKSYKSKSQQSRLMFLLSSQNFYQAYKRLEYLKQYREFRKKQGQEILIQTNKIVSLNDSLLDQKKVKDTLIVSEENQIKEIESDQDLMKNLVAKIKRKENKYKRELQQNVKIEKRITAKIDDLIREEIAKANKLAKTKSTTKTSKKNEFLLTPEAKALAASFELNKGKLPWPVFEGIVVRKFGNQPHPTFPGIIINGTGLHIVTSKDSDAISIFNGEVLNILVGSRGTKNVLIRHGNYISSYNNLETSYVNKGDLITTGQKIGRIFTDKVSKKTKLIFVLFKNTTRLNPASWLLTR